MKNVRNVVNRYLFVLENAIDLLVVRAIQIVLIPGHVEEQAEEASHDAELVEGRECPDCGGALKIKHGRYGKFIGCSNYPKCKHIESFNKASRYRRGMSRMSIKVKW